jgi:hypothetical protein
LEIDGNFYNDINYYNKLNLKFRQLNLNIFNKEEEEDDNDFKYDHKTAAAVTVISPNFNSDCLNNILWDPVWETIGDWQLPNSITKSYCHLIDNLTRLNMRTSFDVYSIANSFDDFHFFDSLRRHRQEYDDSTSLYEPLSMAYYKMSGSLHLGEFLFTNRLQSLYELPSTQNDFDQTFANDYFSNTESKQLKGSKSAGINDFLLFLLQFSMKFFF